jgi:hypothetical protein
MVLGIDLVARDNLNFIWAINLKYKIFLMLIVFL